jgi:hypothetical protein
MDTFRTAELRPGELVPERSELVNKAGSRILLEQTLEERMEVRSISHAMLQTSPSTSRERPCRW